MVSVVIFAAAQSVPQDTAMAALGFESTPQERELFRQAMHLNDPPVDQYLRWLSGIITGNFGQSLVSGRSINNILLERFKYTAILALLALLLALAIALPAAVFVARRSGGSIDAMVSGAALTVSALPEFVIGICLLLIFAVLLRVLPVVSTGITSGDPASFALPVLTLALATTTHIFRLARVSVIETMSASYVQTAILRGFSPRRVLWRHVMPNASVAVINVVALNAIYLLGGVIVVENVFAYPGLGTLLVSAIGFKDIPEIEGVAILISALVIGVNLMADAAVLALSPRLRAARA